MLRRVIDKIAAVPFRYSRIVFIIVLLVTAAASVRVAGLKFEWNLEEFAPRDARSVQDFNEAVETFGSPHYILVTVESDEGPISRSHDSFIRELIDALSASPLIRRAGPALPDRRIKDIKDFALGHILLYLTPEDMARVEKRLSRDGIGEGLPKGVPEEGDFLSRLFADPFEVLIRGPIEAPMRSRDPLAIRSIAAKYFVPKGLKFKKHWRGDYYLSLDKRMAFFLMEPAKPFWNLPAAERLVEGMNDTLSRLEADRRLEGIKVSFAGYHTLVVENYMALKRDTFLTLAITSIGVILIFLVGFRSIRFLPYALVPLTVALIWSLGLAGQLFKSINPFTCVLAVLIVGLGIDFAIHLLNGYRSALAEGMTSEDAWRTSLKNRAAAVFCGACTTIAVFSLLMISDFPGIQQLGLLVSAGLVFVLISVFLFMPAIMRTFEPHWKKSSAAAAAPAKAISWLGIVINEFSLAHPKKIAAVAAVITVLVCFYVYPLGFKPESVEPFTEGSPSAAAIERFADRVELYPEYLFAVSSGRTIPEVLETSYDLYKHLSALQEEGYIALFDSPSRYLPPYSVQRRNLSLLKDTPSLNPETFRKNFLAELDERKNTSAYLRNNYLPMAMRALAVDDIVTFDDIETLGLAGKTKRYLSRGKDGYELATYVFHRKKAYSPSEATSAIEKILETPLIEEGRVKLIGGAMINRELREVLVNNLTTIFILAVLAMLIILFIYFRRISLVALSLVPVLFGVVAMLAAFKLLGYELNFFNAIWVALILGIGIDSGVHMISGYRVSPDLRRASLDEVGRAVTMSTLTTLIAFGSMTLAALPGLRSSGVLAGSGMIFSLIASLVILPGLIGFLCDRN